MHRLAGQRPSNALLVGQRQRNTASNAFGRSRSGASDTEASAQDDPNSAHTKNQPHPSECRGMFETRCIRLLLP
jgi:hypothetical protein